MGCIVSQNNQGLSEELRLQVLQIFKKIDIDGSLSIDKEETARYWKSNFAKINTQELFKAVDFDNSGKITQDEWMCFWEIVKKSGHTEKEIQEELQNLQEGKAWVKFSKVEKFVQKDLKRQRSTIQQIIEVEKKRIIPQTSMTSRKFSEHQTPLNEKN